MRGQNGSGFLEELCLSTSPFLAGQRGGCRQADACRLMTAPGASVCPQGSASFLSPGSKLVRKAIIVLNKMHLLRGGK